MLRGEAYVRRMISRQELSDATVLCAKSYVELIQHISQVNVLLVALPKEQEEPRRIGFMLEKRLGQGGSIGDED